jgi:hypothetical protein
LGAGTMDAESLLDERRMTMALLVIKIPQGHEAYELEPGKTLHLWWNNAQPVSAVWSANAVPVPEHWKSASQLDQDQQLEVTRLWRRFKRKESGALVAEEEHEIHLEVRNIGNEKAAFYVHLCAAS